MSARRDEMGESETRTNILWQLFRFAVINVKILRMVRKH